MNTNLSQKETRAVLDILIEQLGVEEAQLTPEARIREDLSADSLDTVTIIMAVEERFGVTLPEEAGEEVTTVGDLMEALGEVLANAPRAA